MREIFTFEGDHWSQPSAARTTLGLIKFVNKVVEQESRATIGFTGSNLNIYLNCVDEKALENAIAKDQLDLELIIK